MDETDARLDAFWTETRPPERDAAFRLAVMARMARRRLHRRLAAVVVAGVAVTGFVALAGPLPPGSGDALAAAAVALTVLVAFWSLGRLRS